MSQNQDADTARLVYAFAPIHKRALGVAVGLVAGLLLFGLTGFTLVMLPESDRPALELLANYFYGFEVSWSGAFVGLFWAFTTGFVVGWFVAFVRNLVVSIAVFAIRTKAELSQTAHFLDHI